MARKINDAETRQDGRRYYSPVQKDAATFLKTSEETGGERTLIEIEVAPGGGPPPHYHLTYTESFEVLEGTLEVLVGKETRAVRSWGCTESCRSSLACDRRGGSNRYGVSILRTARENPKDVMGARDVREEVGM